MITSEPRPVSQTTHEEELPSPRRHIVAKSLFALYAAASILHPTEKEAPQQPTEAVVQVVALDAAAALSPEIIETTEDTMDRITDGLVKIAIHQSVIPPQGAEIVEQSMGVNGCVPQNILLSPWIRANMFPKINPDVTVVALTSKESCGTPEVLGLTSRTNIDLYRVSALNPDTKTGAFLHELGHAVKLGHQSGIDFTNTNIFGVDPLYETALARSSIDITPRLQAMPFLPYGLKTDCNIMANNFNCPPEANSLSRLQRLFLARQQNTPAPDIRPIDLMNPRTDTQHFADTDWIGQISLPHPAVAVEYRRDGLIEHPFSTLSVVPCKKDSYSSACYQLYLSNEQEPDNYETVYLGRVPGVEMLRELAGEQRDTNAPTIVAINRITVQFNPDGTVAASLNNK